jgi:hypothetical protein
LAGPESTVPGDPCAGGLQGPGGKPATPLAADLPVGEEPCPAQDADVLEKRRQRHAVRLRQLADARLARPELLQDRPADRVGQRGEGSIERTILNHLV